MLIFLLDVTHIDYSLAYAASSRYSSEGEKTEAQDTRVTIEAINIEVNSKYTQVDEYMLD